MFVGMGISAVFPVIDGLSVYGLNQMRSQIGLTWLVLQGALYIWGAGLYAVCSTALDLKRGPANANCAGSLARENRARQI